MKNQSKIANYATPLLLLVIAVFLGINIYSNGKMVAIADNLVFEEEEATVRAIKSVIPAVVTIITSERVRYTAHNPETGKLEIKYQVAQRGSGTGFLISPDGYILTNRHVVESVNGDEPVYQVVLNSGKEYYAMVIDKDPSKDLAVLKIFDKDLPFVELGNSDDIELGVNVMAIGNSLGRYQNSVTKGIISGLGRYLEIPDKMGGLEVLDNVIQTDAEINLGNSGGPLIGLSGRVIGINTAIDTGGTAIGFAIPINDAKPAIKSVIESGIIIRPYMGVRYVMLSEKLAYKNDLPRSDGAWITRGSAETAVVEGSPAAVGGLQEGDIIFEINAIKIDSKNSLYEVIQKYKPGDKIGLKVQRGEKVIILEVTLGDFRNF